MKIGITGAGGYIGSSITLKLLDKGIEVVPIDNFSYSKINEIADTKIYNRNIAEYEPLEELLKNVDCIFHLAAISGLLECGNNKTQTIETNCLGTQNIALLCAKYNIDLVFASSVGVIGNPVSIPITSDHRRQPLNLYTKTKVFGEHIIKTNAINNFNAFIFMIANVYGIHFIINDKVTKNTVINKFVNNAINREPIKIYEPGTQARDFINVNDASKAFVNSLDYITKLENNIEVIPIGTGKSTSISQIAYKVQSICLEELHYRPEIKCVKNPRSNEILTNEFRIDTKKAEDMIKFKADISIDKTISTMFTLEKIVY